MTDDDKALVAELRINDKEIYLPVLGKSADRIEALSAENERLRELLRPFARAESISASYLEDQRIRCVLTYPLNASETFNLAALDNARTALGETE